MDEIARPSYYDLSAYSRLEDLVADMPMFHGTALKYLVRAGKKPSAAALEDMIKARECVELEIYRLSAQV